MSNQNILKQHITDCDWGKKKFIIISELLYSRHHWFMDFLFIQVVLNDLNELSWLRWELKLLHNYGEGHSVLVKGLVRMKVIRRDISLTAIYLAVTCNY